MKLILLLFLLVNILKLIQNFSIKKVESKINLETEIKLENNKSDVNNDVNNKTKENNKQIKINKKVENKKALIEKVDSEKVESEKVDSEKVHSEKVETEKVETGVETEVETKVDSEKVEKSGTELEKKKWGFKGALKKIGGAVKKAAKSVAHDITHPKETAKKAATAVKKTAKAVAHAITHPKETAKRIASGVKKAAVAVKNVAKKVVKKAAAGVKKAGAAIKKVASKVKDVAKKVANKVKEIVKGKPPIQPVVVIKKQTKSNDYGSGATLFLERHNINCQGGSLSKFHFKKDSSQKFKIEYSCTIPEDCEEPCIKAIEAVDKKVCKTLSTPLNSLGNELGNSANFLERHYVKCPANFTLKGFKLERSRPKIKYTFTCCPGLLKDCGTFNTRATPYGDFSTGYLEKQDIKVPKPNQVITGFKLVVNYKKKIWNYKVDYCTVIG